MNILFVLYGDFTTNSANPLVLYARELKKLGHDCAIAVPSNLETVAMHSTQSFTPCLYEDVLADLGSVFNNGRRADVIHACTPRRGVSQFVIQYMAKWPTPLAVFLEDNEAWLSQHHLGLNTQELNASTSDELAKTIPLALAHPFEYRYFVGLADIAFVIQEKLQVDVPAWVPRKTVMLGVDLEFFKPEPDVQESRSTFGLDPDIKVIAYHGGGNQFTLPSIKTLCEAIVLINRAGVKCALLRTGPGPLLFLDELGADVKCYIHDLGVVDKQRLPGILALADLYVQPGEIDPFEDLRLPGKVPEFLAMGKPLVLPNVNIAHLFQDGVDVVLLKNGSPDEIAERCLELFANPEKIRTMGERARILAEQLFDIRKQAKLLEIGYRQAQSFFDIEIAGVIWDMANKYGVRSAALSKVGLIASQESKMSGPISHELIAMQQVENERIQGLENRVADLKNQASVLNSELSSLQEFSEKLSQQKDQEIEQLMERNYALLHSRSWKVTRPLRVMARIPSKAKEWVVSVRVHIQKAGGLGKAIKSAIRIWQADGTRGLWLHLNDRGVDSYSYQQWIEDSQYSDNIQREQVQRLVATLDRKPLISIIVPVFNPPLVYLEKAISSVRDQLYENWELCLADDASTDPGVGELLKKHAEEDPRIKVLFRNENGHISKASNSALSLAGGDYIALLDHDDMLPQDALLHVVAAISKNPSAGIIYSDEDKIDESGNRFDPHFKSDFNYELFLAQNMISHLGVYRRSLVTEVGGFRTGFEGAQDYDLALRVLDLLTKKDIVHIPRVLYHWRAIPGSTARAAGEKNYAAEAGRRAVKEHLDRKGIAAEVVPVPLAPAFNRVIFSRHFTQPMVSILIPTRDRADLLAMCINSVTHLSTYKNYEIIVIDNGSVEEATFRLFDGFDKERIRVVRDESPFNFSRLNNSAAEIAKGEVLCLMNNDIEILTPDWLEEMVSFAIQPDIGAVGARLWYPDGRLQHGGVILGIGGVAGHAHKLLLRGQLGYFGRAVLHQSLSAVTAACLVIRRSIFDKIGGFDETLSVAFNDVDFCLRVREAGLRNIWTPYAEMNHHESASRGQEDKPEKRTRFMNEVKYMQTKWGDKLVADPAYNPNLTLVHEDFSLACVCKSLADTHLSNSV